MGSNCPWDMGDDLRVGQVQERRHAATATVAVARRAGHAGRQARSTASGRCPEYMRTHMGRASDDACGAPESSTFVPRFRSRILEHGTGAIYSIGWQTLVRTGAVSGSAADDEGILTIASALFQRVSPLGQNARVLLRPLCSVHDSDSPSLCRTLRGAEAVIGRGLETRAGKIPQEERPGPPLPRSRGPAPHPVPGHESASSNAR